MEFPTTILGWVYLIGVGGLGFVFVITLVVFVHELGHFLAARYFGVRVESFSIGFGRAIVGFTDRYGTFWKVGWLPLGGYVKFWGDEGVSSAPDHEKIDRATAAERAGSFHHKPLYQKAIIAIGGPLANFILAIAILTSLLLIYGTVATSPQIGFIKAGTPAAAAGFQVGDTVLSINGQPIVEFEDIRRIVTVADGRALDFRVLRNGHELTIPVTPRAIQKEDALRNKVMDPGIGIGQVRPGEVASVVPGSPADSAGLKIGDVVFLAGGQPVESLADVARAMSQAGGRPVILTIVREQQNEKTKIDERKKLEISLTPSAVTDSTANADDTVLQSAGFGVAVKGSPKPEILVTLGPIEAFSRAVGTVQFIVVKTLSFIGQLLTGTGDYQQLSGPIGIASVSGQILVFFGIVNLINLAAVLSVSIGLLNLFPIPMLDGGHLLYYGIEAVRGRPLGERAQELGFRIGFALVISLMLFATWNDISKFALF
jgi:regulator of sigma E protease